MSEVKNMKVQVVDDDHIWVNNRQFISLKRFSEARKEVSDEIKLLNDKNKELAEENEALRILLKNQLDSVTVEPSTETLTNKMCESELDHQWECVGMSTAGTNFRCKKCSAYKTVPIEYQPLSITI